MTELSQFAGRIAISGAVDAASIAEIRRALYNDGIVSRAEAEVLFDIERARTAHSDAWSTLFVEALCDYALNREPPTGYLSEDTAGWIMAQISKRRSPSTDAEIELLTKIVETAREVPPAFSAYALRLVKDMVIYADGPDARGRVHGRGRVDEADVAALQRILWGAGSEGLMAVSREEAEALFAIADATTGAANDPAFDDLFAKAVGNYLLGATGHSVPSRDVALRRETEPAHRLNVLGVLAQTLGSISKVADTRFVADAILNARPLSGDVEQAFALDNDRREEASAAASVMTAAKADWLIDHVDRNGVMTAPEKALVRYIAREASALDPSLSPLLAKAG